MYSYKAVALPVLGYTRKNQNSEKGQKVCLSDEGVGSREGKFGQVV